MMEQKKAEIRNSEQKRKLAMVMRSNMDFFIITLDENDKIPENIIYSYNREIDGEDDEIDLLYFIADKTDVANDAISKIFYENRLSKLTDRDQLIIQMTVNGYSQKEISKKIGISQAQVSRIIRGIVKKYFK